MSTRTKISTTERYKPDDKLIKLMSELYKLGLDKEQIDEEERAKEITKEEADKLREDLNERRSKLHLRTQKNRLLNNYIFPSMANLTVFLEYMATSPYINDIFEEDLKALFLAKSTSTIVKLDRLKRYSIFARFLAAACKLMESKPKVIDKEDDFRIILCDIMQESVYRAVADIASLKFPYDDDSLFLGKTLYSDMDRAFAWTHMLADKAREHLSFDENRRPPQF